jgi:8-oxo-dGTP diphosphatase
METLKIFNEQEVSEEVMNTFIRRVSTRAVMMDDEGKVGLIYSEHLNYYTLPGGGVDEGEHGEQAVIRECKEETGYVVEVVSTLGKVLEIRSEHQKVSEVLGYIVKVVGEKGEAELMPDEIEEQFVIKWVLPSQAKEIFQTEVIHAEPQHQQIGKRALVFLEKAFPEM